MNVVPKKRTNQVNKALYLYFDHLATALNDAGLDMRKVLKPEVDIPWSAIMIKEYLWRPIQTAYIQKQSTADATNDEISRVFKILDRHIAEKFGISVDFPSIEGQLNQQL